MRRNARLLTTALLVSLLAACDCGGAGLTHTNATLATPAALHFGLRLAGTRTTKQLTLSNPGRGTLTIRELAIQSDLRGAFSLGSADDTLGPGESTTLDVTYTAPPEDGSDAATLVVTSEGSDIGVTTVALTGRSTLTCPDGNTESACGDGDDDDCDGLVDCADPDCGGSCAEACTPSGPELRVTHADVDAAAPWLVSTGSEFAMLWVIQRGPAQDMDYEFARVTSPSSAPIGPSRPMDEANVAHPPFLAWNGSEHAVAWSDIRSGHNDIYFRRFSAAGAPTGGELRLTEDDEIDFAATVAWNARDREWGVAWAEQEKGGSNTIGYVTFARVTEAGALVDKRRVTGAFDGTDYPFIVWSGTNYGVTFTAWTEGVLHGRFLRLDAAGNALGEQIDLGTNGAVGGMPRLAWGGDAFGVGWVEPGEGVTRVRFTRVAADGTRLGEATTVAESALATHGALSAPSIAWSGAGWGLAWSERQGPNGVVRFRRLHADGSPASDVRRVDCGAGSGFSPSLAWGGRDYGLAWHDTREGQLEIFFKLLPADFR